MKKKSNFKKYQNSADVQSQLTFTCSKLTTDAIEKGVKYVQN